MQLAPTTILWSYDQWYAVLMLLAICCSCVNSCRIEMERCFLFTSWDGEIRHRGWELKRKDTCKLGKILWFLSVNMQKQNIWLYYS